MGQKGEISPDPTAIGDVSAPPFAVLPMPSRLFAARAARFRALSETNALAPYLSFLGDLAEAQDAITGALPEPARPDPAALTRAKDFEMPPLDRSHITFDVALSATFDQLFARAAAIEQPKAASDALARVAAAGQIERKTMLDNVLADSLPVETLAEHVYVAAALQVHFARLAASLDVTLLPRLGDGNCPACGGAPASTMVVGWPGAHGARFCACSLCGTLWNVVRIKCVLCGSTEGIGYQEIDNGPGTVKAETCERCHSWVKILHQHMDPGIEPIADDVASLGLDLLMREGPYRRGGFNPFLTGY